MKTILEKYLGQINNAYFEIAQFKYNKAIIENNAVRIVVYKVGPVIRIDVKEKDNDSGE